MVAVLGAITLPWLGLNLSPGLRSWNLAFSLGAVPLVGHISYGLVVSILAICAIVSFTEAGWRTTRVTRCVGWVFVALPVIFVVTTRISGGSTMFRLADDVNQAGILNSQFLTDNSVPAPTQFLGIGFDGRTLTILYALRLGWYLLLASGVLLAGRVGRPSTRGQWFGAAAALAGVVVVVVGLLFSTVAQSDLDRAAQSVADGNGVAAQDLLASAARWNPAVAWGSGYQRTVGQSEALRGESSPLADYAQAVRSEGKDVTLLEQARLFTSALRGLPPGSPAASVVRADLVSFVAQATVTAKNPTILTLVRQQLGSPAVSFTTGRFYYEAGADSLAITTLEEVLRSTGNSEFRSLALTYIALSWQQMGNESEFRRNITAAVAADSLNENVYAREIAAGLYVPGSP
jgi:hypothetical protein